MFSPAKIFFSHFIFLALASQGFRTNTIFSKTLWLETNTDTSWLWHYTKSQEFLKRSSSHPLGTPTAHRTEVLDGQTVWTKTNSLDWRRNSNFYKFNGNIWTDSLELARTEATTRIFNQIENVSSAWVSTEALRGKWENHFYLFIYFSVTWWVEKKKKIARIVVFFICETFITCQDHFSNRFVFFKFSFRPHKAEEHL